jgi:hypothetical protein
MSPELLPYVRVIFGKLVKLLEYSGGLIIRLWISLYKAARLVLNSHMFSRAHPNANIMFHYLERSQVLF